MINFIRANIEDARKLTDIQIETFDDDSRRFFNRPAGGPPQYNSVDAQINYIKNNIYFKIVCNDDIIGGINIQAIDNHHYELTTIYIKPSEQKKGIGQEAINFLEKEFPLVTKWTLDTPSVCVRNHHLYEKMGYKKTDKILLDKASSLYLYLYEKIINN